VDYSEVVKKIKSSIALVVALNPAGDFISTGSGFIYGKKIY